MFFDISKLETGTTRIEREFDAADIPFDYRGYALAGTWIFAAEFTKNAKEEVAIHGRIQGDVQVFCDRCLEPFAHRVDQPFDQYLIPVGRISTETEEELNQEKLDENFYRDPKISIADVVNEQIILSLPLKLLCREECRGLCPKCGGNLNLGGCDCSREEADPRLQLLREIRNRIKNT